jgi:hypothetical protein
MKACGASSRNPPSNALAGDAENEAAQARHCAPIVKAGDHLVIQTEEIAMGGIANLAGALGGGGGGGGAGGVDLSQLQQTEQQAIQDMLAISQNQIQFNTQMNQAKAVHQAANSFQLNA